MHAIKTVGPVAIVAATPATQALEDKIAAAWERQLAEIRRDNPDYIPTIAGFTYWLVRWSGLIQEAPDEH